MFYKTENIKVFKGKLLLTKKLSITLLIFKNVIKLSTICQEKYNVFLNKFFKCFSPETLKKFTLS